ncbi:MAG TPA: glycosyltransferase family 39 protein [Longimicrobiaceae bacterium]|nr:glycosyltransferase family 39 protein [Longimicrobiaceae bacterium]
MLAVILLAALAAKLALWALYLAADPSAFLQPDSASYHESARSLLASGTFAVSPDDPTPQTVRTPGYPAFLAAVYALAGEEPAAAILVQLLLGVATVAVAYLLVRRLAGPRVGLLAAALMALDVPSHRYSLVLLTETLFALLLAAALACGVALLTGGERRRWALGLGVALAAACLVRPVAYYLVIPVGLGLLVQGWRAGWGRRETAVTAALVVLPFAVAVGGWQYRNWRVSGSAALSHVDGRVFLFHRGADIVARRDGIGFLAAREQLQQAYGLDAPGASVAGTNARWRAAGVELIRRHPGIYARTVAGGVARTLLVPGEIPFPPHAARAPEPGWRSELRERGVLGALRGRVARRGAGETATFSLAALHVVVVSLGAAYCLWTLAARRKATVADVFLLGVLLYMLLIQAGPTAGPRSRLPVEPILVLYAARGLADLGGRLRTRPRTSLQPSPG